LLQVIRGKDIKISEASDLAQKPEAPPPCCPAPFLLPLEEGAVMTTVLMDLP